MARLGVTAPDPAPRATEHIPEMVALIERLVASGMAYAVDGDVYFEVARFPTYGHLSGKNLDELLAGRAGRRGRAEARPARLRALEGGEARRAVLAEPLGPRPAGLAHRVLGDGDEATSARRSTCTAAGEDLIFPHHENEIAQSEGATGKPFARYWLHNGFVNLGAEKMSKSLGNTLTVEALLTPARSGGAPALPPPDPLPEPGGVLRGRGRGDAAPARAVPGAGRSGQ